MKTISVRASRNYTVSIAPGLLDRTGELLRPLTEASRAALVCGDRVWPLYGERTAASLEAAGFSVCVKVIPHGEEHKTLATYGELLNFFVEKELTRSDLVVALGGGVTGDLAGFAAATYQRGVGFVQLPTTLLAAVDSSVGGKTAVDLPGGKNQAGAFYQPLAVVCDTDTLSTLSEEEYRCGCAEVIKYGVLFDRGFFDSLRRTPVSGQYEDVIAACVAFKRDAVEADEFDRGARRLLNLGHSFGHAVESCSGFTVRHGEAVAIGMAMIARAAAARGLCAEACRDEILSLLDAYALPTRTSLPAAELLAALRRDKKRGGRRMAARRRGTMTVTIPGGVRSGSIRIPASKSQAHRLLICAALGQTDCEIRCDGVSRDIAATADCLAALGASFSITGERILVRPIREIPAGELLLPCGESGSTLRFLLPVAGVLGASVRFRRLGRLAARPLAPFDAELRRHGMTIESDGDDLLCSGRLVGGGWRLPGDVSSQYISALLMALPLLEGSSRLTVTSALQSAPYVAMTERVLHSASVSFSRDALRYTIPGGQRPRLPASVAVEGDWSNAAFFLALGALSPEGVTVTGLDENSAQGDRAVTEILRRFGAELSFAPGAVSVRRNGLRGITLDAAQIPDLVPPLAALAALAEGESRIENASRLRLKESDRLESTASMLSSLGARIRTEGDCLVISGQSSLSGGETESFSDHRIAMAAAVAACGCRGSVAVRGAECVDKSYPRFWDDYFSLGGNA